jgi:type I restriction enzyme S subunit
MYGATVGKTAVLKANASTNQAICGISPGPDLDAEYLRYHLMFLRNDLLSQRYGGAQPNISQQIIRNQTVAYPPLSEQKSIAHTLLTVQRAIAAQERIIQTTTELKKALMQKLFTEGLRGEPQKETEIGLVPESWEVVQLGELLDTAQYGISVKGNPSGNCAILRMTNQVDGKIVGEKLQFTEISEGEIQRFRVHRGDILFNRTNSLDLVGRTAIFDVEGEYVFASYLIRLRTKERKLNPFFLNCYFNTDETQARLKSIATRAVSQSNISATRLKGFLIPNPSIDEQKQIVSTGISIDQKLAAHRSKLEQLKNIFRTLLRELMTAKIHVHCLGFSNSTTAISR